MTNPDRFSSCVVIAEVAMDSEVYPTAVLCKVVSPLGPGDPSKPWVVWPVSKDDDRGSGSYHSTFEKAWDVLGGLAKK
jgi:hypothetical protein